MEEIKNTEAMKKPTYEELNDYCNQLMMQNKNLAHRLNQVMDAQNSIPYLFELIKMPDVFGTEYVEKASTLIKSMLFPPVKTNDDTEENTNESESKEE